MSSWAGTIVISALAITEVTAAFWGKVRHGEIEAEFAALLDQEFHADLVDGRFAIVPIARSVTARSVETVRRHRLRAGDGIQLATAIEARTADATVSAFAVYDAGLRAAAAAEGFRLLPAST